MERPKRQILGARQAAWGAARKTVDAMPSVATLSCAAWA